VNAFGLTLWDWIVLAVYLAGITCIGLYAARYVKDTADYFLAGRRFRKTFMLFFTFGAGTHSDQAVSVASKTYTDGLSGIWYQWFWLFNTPFYWLFPPIFRRMRALTTADFFDLRYAKSVAALFAFVGIFQTVVNLGTMLKGCGSMITAVSGGSINEIAAVVVVTILFMVYGIAGGLSAAILTDFVQGILTICLSFLVLPFALQAVGGIAGLKETINNPQMFSLVVPGGIGVFYITMITINGLVGIVTQPHVMGTCAAGQTEMDVRVGFCYGNMLKRVCTVAWTLTGLCAIAMYPGLSTKLQIDQTYGLMARDLLPLILPGLVGLFIASLLATVMSSCDAWMIACSALFTENVYKPFFAPNKSEPHYVKVGRIVAGLIVLNGILVAFSLDSVIDGLELFWKIQAMMGIAFWVGLFWRRATVAAAWTSTLAAFGALLYTHFYPNHFPEIMLYNGGLYLPYQMVIYLTVGLITMIVVSLYTKRVDSSKLDKLHRALHTPVAPNEHPTEPFEVPEDSQPEPIRKIINHPDWEIGWPSRIDIIGFIIAWILVAALIGTVYWIAGM